MVNLLIDLIIGLNNYLIKIGIAQQIAELLVNLYQLFMFQVFYNLMVHLDPRLL
jgi:hypothetical protein